MSLTSDQELFGFIDLNESDFYEAVFIPRGEASIKEINAYGAIRRRVQMPVLLVKENREVILDTPFSPWDQYQNHLLTHSYRKVPDGTFLWLVNFLECIKLKKPVYGSIAQAEPMFKMSRTGQGLSVRYEIRFIGLRNPQYAIEIPYP